MEKIVYFKLFQIVLTLTIILQILSLRQFCGTFADPKAFLYGNCERIMLIGKDSKTGEFGSYNKLYRQFIMNSTKEQQNQELECQFFDKFAATLPPAGHECIPITITPFDRIFKWIGMLNRNPLNNRTLFLFSDLFLFALVSLGDLGYGIMKMRRSMEEYKSSAYSRAFFSVFCWCCIGVNSFKLLFYWTGFWTCINFRADHTNVPFVTLVLCIVMVCLFISEVVFYEFELNDVDMEGDNVMIIDQQPKKKNESACCAIE